MSARAPRLSRRAVLAAALAGAPAAAQGAPRRRPNIVFILADDLGAFDLSCYGRPDYRTPNIDSLARDGLRFDSAYANSNTCTPTRVAIMSGRYPNRMEIGVVGPAPAADVGFPPETPNLASTLRAAGYATGLIGKWNLGALPRFSPNASGYDEFFGFTSGAIDYWTHDVGLRDGTRQPDLYENGRSAETPGYATDLFTDRAVDFIRRHRATPFLLSLHYNAPHWPWQTRSDAGPSRLNDVHFDGGSPAIYAEMVRVLDESVGRILQALDRHDLARDTLVIFTSDNGGERFSHMWPLRGAKGDLYEGGIRVPLLTRWPGQVARGRRSGQVALSMDWLPTFAEAAGVACDPGAAPDGVSLLPHLLGAPAAERTVFWWVGEDQAALRYPWKLVRIGGREHLYNLEQDPTEHANLKLAQPERLAELRQALAAWSEGMRPGPPAAAAARRAQIEALEALQSPWSGPATPPRP